MQIGPIPFFYTGMFRPPKTDSAGNPKNLREI
jgi:hypothetical protein